MTLLLPDFICIAVLLSHLKDYNVNYTVANEVCTVLFLLRFCVHLASFLIEENMLNSF